MQVEGYRGSEQGFGVAPRGIRCRATSVPWIEALIPETRRLGRRDHRKSGRNGRFPYLPWSALDADLLALLAALAVRELFANASRFSRTIAQVIKLCPAHVALAFHFDTRNER